MLGNRIRHTNKDEALTQIGVVLGLGFIVKQRSGYGLDYRLLAVTRGYNPRTLHLPHVIKLVT